MYIYIYRNINEYLWHHNLDLNPCEINRSNLHMFIHGMIYPPKNGGTFHIRSIRSNKMVRFRKFHGIIVIFLITQILLITILMNKYPFYF